MTTPVKIHRNQKHKTALIGMRGKIVVWTIIRTASKNFNNQAPFPVVIVKLDNNEKVMGQLVDWTDENLQNGQKVEAVLRRIGVEDREGVINYSIKFKPI